VWGRAPNFGKRAADVSERGRGGKRVSSPMGKALAMIKAGSIHRDAKGAEDRFRKAGCSPKNRIAGKHEGWTRGS